MRVTAVGVYSTFEAKKGGSMQGEGQSTGIRIPYMRVLGITVDNEASDIMVGKFDKEDEEAMLRISRTPDLYSRVSNSLAPALFGHDDIKRSIACQLFGGARKQLPDGMRLRGDINVLLLGDPSVGKSQFLKFAIQVAPIGVYTSGKGSSAAGLTASVLRDPSSGEYHLEGGALVLADGGLVCIDEFDKMREQDRVAIHEAMEQQTISIAKAGITTILNSRTSVLAAANPIFSRYDDMKSPTENIDFQTTILSRFDLIFILRDVQNERRDMSLAKHVLSVHKNQARAMTESQEQTGLLPLDTLKKYIAYARASVDPRLSEEAAKLLKNR
jgi:DNA replication licensing factor MCM5